MHFSNIVASLALIGSAVALPPPPQYPQGPPGPPGPPKPVGPPHPPKGDGKNQTLYQAMQKRGRSYIGTAVTLRNESREVDVIQTEFNSMTPENAMKWESTQPSRGNYTFADGDRHAEFARKNKLDLRCHTLVWHSQLPLWVSEGGFDNATLIQVMEEHIKALATRWKNCAQWDVVNEALNENGTYRSSVFYETIGEAYIPIAFRLAKKYAPKALLFYNDYNIEDNGNKTAGAVRIVKLIKSYGVHIDGVGYQGHLTSEATKSNPSGAAPDQKTLEAALRATADLGVKVAYTELDVRLNTTTTSPEKVAQQLAVWENVARACLSVKACIGMTVWGVSDKYSWIPGVFKGEGSGLLFDDEYNKKPAYYSFLKGIEGPKKP